MIPMVLIGLTNHVLLGKVVREKSIASNAYHHRLQTEWEAEMEAKMNLKSECMRVLSVMKVKLTT